MNPIKTIILASSSPRRQELISSLGLPMEIVTSHADETTDPGLAPEDVVQTLAFRKAETVRQKLIENGGEGIIVGADTIVVLDDSILGKPKNNRDAYRMLSLLQGKTHQVYSGVACIDLKSGQTAGGFRMTRVTMRPLNEGEIRRYIATGEPHDKAGSYAIQGFGATIVERIEGDYFNVVGLPLELLSKLLEPFGVRVF